MRGFVIGRVVEPEVNDRTIQGKPRQMASFGLLSGKTCTTFDVFDDDKNFDKVVDLQEDENVLVIFNTSIDKKNMMERVYLRSVGLCPEGLNEQLRDLVK